MGITAWLEAETPDGPFTPSSTCAVLDANGYVLIYTPADVGAGW